MKGSLIAEYFSFFYNFDEFKYQAINKYTNLSRKYSDLDYLKNEPNENHIYDHILDRWQIKNNINLLSLFRNVFYPLHKIWFMIKKIFKTLKNKTL